MSARVPSGNILLSLEPRSGINFARVLTKTLVLTTVLIREPRYFSVMLVEFHSIHMQLVLRTRSLALSLQVLSICNI